MSKFRVDFDIVKDLPYWYRGSTFVAHYSFFVKARGIEEASGKAYSKIPFDCHYGNSNDVMIDCINVREI